MKRIVVLTLLAFGLVSCKKFLTESSQSDVVPKTTTDFGEILYTNGYPTNTTLLQPYINFMDDDLQCYNGASIASSQDYVHFNAGAYQWQPDFIDVITQAGSTDALSFNSWSNYYQMILGTNVALQYMDKSVGSAAEKARYKGEAYALRAFYHFMLVNLYAKPYNDSTTTPDKSKGVPIMLSANLSDALPERKSVKEVYTQVLSDLDSAMYFLDQDKTEQRLFRVSHVAAHLLASRVYLYMEQWDKVIENADYVLAYHPQLMDLNNWGDPDPEAKTVVGNGNVETIWYYGSNQETLPTGTNMAYDVSDDLASCFDANDLRPLVYFTVVPEFLKFYTPCDYTYMKTYVSYVTATGYMGSAWRSSESYLNRAEAYIQLYRSKGDAAAATAALESLNTLRAKRIDQNSFVPWGMHPADTLLQMCRMERRRELFRECGHRWFDLRRYGMPAMKHIYMPDPNTTQIYQLAARDPQYVIPIPNEVLLRNPALGQNPQMAGLRLPQ